MKRNTAFFACSLLALTMLPGCSINASSSYYTVEVYADYVGMEQDLQDLGHYRTERSHRVAVGYALKDQKFLSDGLRSYKDNEGKAYDYRKSSRTAEHGYQYDFVGFAGFYEDNSAINLNKITADCSVFCSFEKNKVDYLVTVQDAFGVTYNDFSNKLSFGTKVSDDADLLASLLPFPDHDVSHDRDAYYMSYAPLGWNVYRYKSDDEKTEAEKAANKDVVLDPHGLRDANDKPVTEFLPYDDEDAIKNYVIADRTVFEAAYADGVEKEYTVQLSYQLRTLDHYDSQGKPIYNYGDFAAAPAVTSQVVPYGKGIDEEALAVPYYKIVGVGHNGTPDVYGNTDDVPSILRGENISRKVIKYDCAITLIYEKVESATLRFHADLAELDHVPANTDDVNYTQTILLEDGAIAPELLHKDALSAYRFTNTWTTTPFNPSVLNYEPFDISRILATGTVDLYPILLPREIAQGTLHFELDLAFGGYMLHNIDTGTTVYDDAVVEDANFPTRYPYVGVYAFGDAAGDLTSVKLGNRVSYIGHGELASLASATTIDLKDSKITELPSYAFKSLLATETYKLPSTLEKVGRDLFSRCQNVDAIEIDMTLAQVQSKIDSGDFYADWALGFESKVVYKS